MLFGAEKPQHQNAGWKIKHCNKHIVFVVAASLTRLFYQPMSYEVYVSIYVDKCGAACAVDIRYGIPIVGREKRCKRFA